MRGKHILLIEPDAYLAGIYAAKFASEHLQTQVAETLSSARKSIKKSVPKAVVVYVAVDQESGFDFIHELRSDPKTFAVPIFVLTALAAREHIARAFAAGATDYLIKGHFVPIEAVRKVKKAVLQ